jgi:rRNA-processing protein FCF1
MKVILDTNFFLVPFQAGLDVFKEVEVLFEERFMEAPEYLVLSCSLDELCELNKINKRIVEEIIEKNKIKIISCAGKSDEKLMEFAAREKALVATNDRRLRAELRRVGIKTLALRGKNHLEIQ